MVAIDCWRTSVRFRQAIGLAGLNLQENEGDVFMADKDQKKKSSTNKPKLSVKEKKERNERKRAARGSK
jgi:hypothetical protein